MKMRFISLLVVASMLLAACSAASSTPAPAAPTGPSAVTPQVTAAPAGARPVIEGTIVQPWTMDGYTTAEQWDREFTYMQEAGMDLFIFQWTADSNYKTTVFETAIPGWEQTAKPDQVALALAMAKKHHMKVMLGLAFNEQWFSKQGTDKAWLTEQAAAMNLVADDLYQKFFAAYPETFAGWYINWEMDNVSGYNTDAGQKQTMTDALKTVVDHLHSLNAQLPVGMAPYFNVKMGAKPAEWKAFWAEMTGKTGLDIIMLQDGVGVGHAKVEDLPEWFEAVCAGVHAAGKQCWDDLEIFTGQSAVNSPAPTERIIQQIQAAAPYVDKIVSFSFNVAMSPEYGLDPQVYARYRAYVDGQQGLTTATPLAPTPTRSGPTPTLIVTPDPLPPVSGSAQTPLFSQGTFIQPWTLDGYTEAVQWEHEFALMKDVDLSLVILQWTADSKAQTTIYDTAMPGWQRSAPYDEVDRLLSYAEQNGFQVFLGLAFSEDWWSMEGSNREWMLSEAEKMSAVGGELYQKYQAKYPRAFAGWYINWEMDNQSSYNANPEHRQNMKDALNVVTGYLKSLNPALPASIAPYFNAASGATPAEWQAFWQDMLSATRVDILMLQDGVGVAHARVEDLPAWFEAVCAGVHAAGKQCWDDLENFTGTSSLQPAPIERVIAQHQAAAPYVDKIVTYSFIEAMSPEFGFDPMVYNLYKAYVDGLARRPTATPIIPTPTVALPTAVPTMTPAAPRPTAGSIKPITTGSFTQPWTVDEYTPEKWDQEFQLMSDLGMDLFIFQWTADSKAQTTIYPTGLDGWSQTSPYDQIEAGLAAAKKHHIKVFMGLAFSEDWWMKQGSDRAWLMQQVEVMNKIADEIYARYHASYPETLAGWYINWEMDNASAYNTDETQKQNMIDALNAVSAHLHALNPGLKTSIAPYFNARSGMRPDDWGAFWQQVLSGADVDILMLQDGVGVGHAAVDDLPRWFEAVCKGVHAAGKECWDDLENFTGASAVNNPAPIERLVAQHQAAAPFVDKIVTFSFNVAMSPVFGVDAKALAAYKAYVEAQK